MVGGVVDDIAAGMWTVCDRTVGTSHYSTGYRRVCAHVYVLDDHSMTEQGPHDVYIPVYVYDDRSIPAVMTARLTT